jgi:hypothetical protein
LRRGVIEILSSSVVPTEAILGSVTTLE